jgi:hypothetical protein
MNAKSISLSREQQTIMPGIDLTRANGFSSLAGIESVAPVIHYDR